ncbi:MAG: tRNA preQ1(34) S-adenosylmethionine ribosyltransferase-isomerase QueA [Nitrolancea sp.]
MPQDSITHSNEPILISEYDYELPEELIAQTPVEPRDSSRLLVLDRHRGKIEHRTFRDVGDYLSPADLLVINDSRVLPARLHGRRPTGGHVEILLLRRVGDRAWEALVRPGRRLIPGSHIELTMADGRSSDEIAVVLDRDEDGQATVEIPTAVEERLHEFGEMPLPPYIHTRLEDAERYQTVYADEAGSAAAPTAGLHFTPELMNSLRQRGIRFAHVTLHVGIGTFLPVKVDDARQHHMHAEWFHVPSATINAIRETRSRGGRIVAVGTTSCRTLESIDIDAAGPEGASDWTRLFITPGFEFRVVDALITNFHLPKSTLMLLVSALAGRDNILGTYREAIEHRYRFFSFGDAMLII